MPRLELYPFRYRDPVTGKWVRARYKAERHEIAARYAEWEIIGPPEIRDADPGSAWFNPYRATAAAELKRLAEPAPHVNPHLDQPPAIDGHERFLVALFLRRYLAYCARRRQKEAMLAAAALLREINRAA